MSLTPVNPVAAARKKYRRAMRARQTTLWVVLIGSMLGVGLLAAAVYTGQIKSPWDRPFSTPAAEPTTAIRQPCPSSKKALYLSPKKVRVNVLNGTDQVGLAAGVQKDLRERGFVAPAPGNDQSGAIPQAAIIRTGIAGVDAAYTVATQVDGTVVIKLDTRETKDVDLVLGDGFDQLKDKKKATINTKARIVPAPNCANVKAEPLPKTSPTATKKK